MLYRSIIKGLLIVALFSFFGCSSRRYGTSYYNSYNYPSYGTSSKINNSKNMHKATMRPYTVAGKRYYPTMVSVGDTFSGVASWYGRDFHGKKTSNGEYYNMYDLTAAHKTLPMNTMVKVTNLRNNRSVVVRVNDRGPFVNNRIIDLSYAAAKRLGMIAKGTAPVRLEVVGFKGVINRGDDTEKSVQMSNYLVQIGAFRREEGARRFARENSLDRYKAVVKKYFYNGAPLYRVYLSGFMSEAEARDFIKKGLFRGSFIVRE